MRKLAVLTVAASVLTAAFPAIADTPQLRETRDNSCGSKAFETVAGGYRHLTHGLTGKTQVGEALLEWCQDARNAVIYFYVDDPTGADHKRCPENMSIAVFPGRGAEVEQILRDNEPSYYMPNVKLIEEPHTAPMKIDGGKRTIDGWRMQAVLIDSGGYKRRQSMIGYQRGRDFVRVMTGVVDDGTCANPTMKSFMTKLDWP